ncbi:hypothetical protein CAPTEDRAFT_201718, partial [Capitella teleta]
MDNTSGCIVKKIVNAFTMVAIVGLIYMVLSTAKGLSSGVGKITNIAMKHYSHESTWIQKRKRLLRTTSKVKLLILYLPMRDSHNLFEVFNQDTEAVAWVDPFKIFSRSPLNVDEAEDTRKHPYRSPIKDALDVLFNCSLGSISPLLLLDSALRNNTILHNYNTCMARSPSVRQIKKCPEKLNKICQGTHSRTKCASKVLKSKSNSKEFIKSSGSKTTMQNEFNKCETLTFLRSDACLTLVDAVTKCRDRKIQSVISSSFNVSSLRTYIKETPDLFIAYYVRHPFSLADQLASQGKKSINVTLSHICKTMASDIRSLLEFEKHYP